MVHLLFIAKLPGWSKNAWGGDVHTTQLATYLAKEGVSITYLNEELDETCEGVHFRKTPYIKYRSRPFYPKEGNLFRILEEEKPDVVHHFSTMGFTFERIRKQNSRWAKVPSVCSLWTSRFSAGGVDSLWGFIKRGKVFRALAAQREIYASRHADYVGVASEAMRRELVRVFNLPREKIRVIPRGVELDLFHSAPFPKRQTDEGVILYAGRLEKEKGLEVLIRAYALITQEHPKFQLRIVGDGPDRENLQALAEELDILQKITWVNRIPHKEMPREYALADAVVLLSGFEPFGAVIVEAGAVGRPAIVTKSGGPAELVLDGKTGIIVDPCNDISVAKSIVNLLTDRRLLIKMGETARGFVTEKYTFSLEAQNYTRLYQSLLA